MAEKNPTEVLAKLRVSLVGTLPPSRGVSAYCRALAMALAEVIEVEFFDFKSLYPKFLYPGGDTEDTSSLPPQHHNLTIRRELTWYNPLSWFAAGKGFSGQILHIQWWSLPLAPIMIVIAAMARVRKVPVVVTAHNVDTHAGKSTLFRLASKILFSLSDQIIVHSKNNSGSLAQTYAQNPDRISVIRHGILNSPKTASYSKDDACRRLGIPDRTNVLLMFGAIRDYKGIESAIRALPSVVEQHPETILLVAGAPWGPSDKYVELAKKLKVLENVLFDMRYIPDNEISLLFSCADIFLLPYKNFEGQSGAGMAALAHGLPIIVSNTGGLSELVSDSNSVIEPDDCRALSFRIQTILSNETLRGHLERDSGRIADGHRWDCIAEHTRSLYDSCIVEAR